MGCDYINAHFGIAALVITSANERKRKEIEMRATDVTMMDLDLVAVDYPWDEMGNWIFNHEMFIQHCYQLESIRDEYLAEDCLPF